MAQMYSWLFNLCHISKKQNYYHIFPYCDCSCLFLIFLYELFFITCVNCFFMRHVHMSIKCFLFIKIFVAHIKVNWSCAQNHILRTRNPWIYIVSLPLLPESFLMLILLNHCFQHFNNSVHYQFFIISAIFL